MSMRWPSTRAIQRRSMQPPSSAGVFKSTNGGASWRRVGLGRWARSSSTPRTRRRSTRARKGAAVGGNRARSGVFKSTDGGSSWRAVGLQGKNVTWLALDPEDTNIVYAGTYEHGVFKISDGGSSWRAAGFPGKDGDGLTFDPQNADTVYANSEGRIFKSADGGRTWRAL